MTDAIAVVNAGSSSVKFSLFAVRGGELVLAVRGQAEGLYTAPHFMATDAGGKALADKSWSNGFVLGHDGALLSETSFMVDSVCGE